MPRMMGNLGFPRLITQFRQDKNAPYYAWQTAGLLLGLKECTTQDEFIEILNKRGSLTSLTGKEVDSAILAYALSGVPAEKYTDKEQIYKSVLGNIGLNIDPDRKTIMYRQCYPTFRFVDTVGLVCPFLAAAAQEENDDKYARLAVSQIMEFEKVAFNDDYDYLPFHAYDLATKTPLGKYGWGRGTGWYALGLIDTYSELDTCSELDAGSRVDLQGSIIRLAETLKKYQKEDGGWASSINDGSMRTDTSATALFLYFIKRAGSLGVIKKDSYRQCVDSAQQCLMDNTNRDGRIMNSEGDCIAAGNYSYDYKTMPFTLGITLRAVCLE